MPCGRHIASLARLSGAAGGGADGGSCPTFSKRSTRQSGARRLEKLWKRYGNFVIAAAVLLVLAVGAWRGYQWWEAQKAAKASAAFEAATELADQGKPAEAEAAFARLAADGTAGYRVLARLREASVLAERDPKAAVAAYDAIANDASVGRTLQELAGVRAALLLVDSAPLSEMTRRLEPLTQPDSAFRHTAREILALAAFKAGDKVAARSGLT